MESAGSTVLVTGGAGFIGSHLVDRLCREGHRVRVLDNFATGRRENLAAMPDGVELVEGDVQSYEQVHRCVSGCELVFHEAAVPSVPRSVRDPLTSHAANVTGTLNVLLSARDEGVRRVVFASSSSTYGANRELPAREQTPALPISPYAVGKLAAEGYCRAFFEVYGLETVALRYFNIFGPRQDPLSEYAAVIPRFITSMLEGRSPVVYGDGEQSRDFTYVDNAVAANLLAADAEGVAGQTFNIACGGDDQPQCPARGARRDHRHRDRRGPRGAATWRRPQLARRHLQGARSARIRAGDRPPRGAVADRRLAAGRAVRRSGHFGCGLTWSACNE